MKETRCKCWIRLFSIILIVIPTMIFGFRDQPHQMGIALIMGSIAASFLNLEKFDFIKGGGFEAKLKEAKDVVSQAQVTIEKLNQIMEPLLISSLNTTMNIGRFNGGGSTEQKIIIGDDSKKIANDLGIVSDRLSDAINIFYMYMGWDLYNDLIEMAKSIDPHSPQKGGLVDPYWIMPPNAYKNTNFPLPINLTEFQEFADDEKYGELREKNENYRKFLKTHFDLS